ncbi:MAG TPA: radical SAM protein [Candidatus Onthoplasma faecigallinarum]|nr:radical SAM protein [Candidatus Onthoplasma faecigallinarum]
MSNDTRPMGIYIHIPFCSKKCDYCDFVSYSMDTKAQQLYLDALFTEIDMVKNKFMDKTFDSIFIGGGTPSIVYEGFISSLARKLYSSFHFADKIEFSIEVNPSSFTKEKFFEYVEAGVNRISVGVQCLDQKLLANHGRIQSVDNVKETFKILRESEFPNVNGDVMIGLPGQSKRSVVQTIKFLLKTK